MDWTIGLLLLIVGSIIGFFLGRAATQPNTSEIESSTKLTNVDTTEHVNEYISVTKDLVDQLQTQLKQLDQRIASVDNNRGTGAAQNDKTEVHLYGEQAAQYLGKSKGRGDSHKEQADQQPKDFSKDRTGLFSNSENRQVVEEK